ncbi:MAG: hypothetical protein MJZ25_15660 [Fibrobacter sp.]|nr:hypothetical protein [Fibrobacter sp.]
MITPETYTETFYVIKTANDTYLNVNSFPMDRVIVTHSRSASQYAMAEYAQNDIEKLKNRSDEYHDLYKLGLSVVKVVVTYSESKV